MLQSLAHLVGRSGRLLVVNLLATGLALFVHLQLARTLGSASYGIYVYALTWGSMLALIAPLGTEPLVVRQVSVSRAVGDWPALKGIVRYSCLMVAIAGAMFCLGGSQVLRWLGDGLTEELRTTLLLLLLFVPVAALLQIGLSVMNGLELQVRGATLGHLVRPIIFIVLLFAVVLFGATADAALSMLLNTAAAVVALLLVTMSLYRRLAPSLHKVTPRYAARSWLTSSLFLLLVTVLHVVIGQADVVMIGVLLDTDAVAVYSPAAKIAGLAIFPMMAVNAVVVPMIAAHYASGQRQYLRRILCLTVVATSAAAIPIAIIFWLFAPELLGLFGPAFVAGKTALVILTLGHLVNVLTGPVDYLLMMTGFERLAAGVLAVTALINVMLNILLIPRYGIEGAAVATAVGIAFWNLGMAAVVWWKLRINPLPLPLRTR